jgi:hypothetical protein
MKLLPVGIAIAIIIAVIIFFPRRPPDLRRRLGKPMKPMPPEDQSEGEQGDRAG